MHHLRGGTCQIRCSFCSCQLFQFCLSVLSLLIVLQESLSLLFVWQECLPSVIVWQEHAFPHCLRGLFPHYCWEKCISPRLVSEECLFPHCLRRISLPSFIGVSPLIYHLRSVFSLICCLIEVCHPSLFERNVPSLILWEGCALPELLTNLSSDSNK